MPYNSNPLSRDEVQLMNNNYIPPTINYSNLDPECDLNYVPNKGISHKINYTLSNNFGFGGHNSCILFKKV